MQIQGQRTLTNEYDHLANRAAEGDKAALDELLRVIQPAVMRRCGAMLLYRPDAEEACQDVLVKVARGINQFAGRSTFATWLYPIVTNCVRDTYRSLRRRADEAPAEELAQQPDPHTTSVIAGARIAVLDAIDKLEQRSPELVHPFVLRDVYDLEYADIAQQLDLPLSTVTYRIRQARIFIRRHLER